MLLEIILFFKILVFNQLFCTKIYLIVCGFYDVESLIVITLINNNFYSFVPTIEWPLMVIFIIISRIQGNPRPSGCNRNTRRAQFQYPDMTGHRGQGKPSRAHSRHTCRLGGSTARSMRPLSGVILGAHQMRHGHKSTASPLATWGQSTCPCPSSVRGGVYLSSSERPFQYGAGVCH